MDIIPGRAVTNSDRISAIYAHVDRTIGRVHRAYDEYITDDLRIQILHVKSSLFKPYEVLVTAGMSALPMSVPEETTFPKFAEIVTLLPKKWPLTIEQLQEDRNFWPIRMMKDIARYTIHNQTWIGFGHTVAMASSEEDLTPLGTDVPFCASLIVPPLSLGEKAFTMMKPQETCFWAAVPLHKRELQFKLENGVDALLDAFDRAKVTDRINPARLCVV